MKRTWVVYVTQGVGHELNNCITESMWYGPYTQEVAEKLANDLNQILVNYGGEYPVAHTMPLDGWSSVSRVLKQAREDLADYSKEEITN